MGLRNQLGIILWAFFAFAVAYDVSISEKDAISEVCTGMWANDKTHINVTFSETSVGRLSMIIYEFSDVHFLGKVTGEDTDWPQTTYVCTSNALQAKLCDVSQLGRFIINLPPDKTINDTSIWTESVGFKWNISSPNQPGNLPTPPSSPANGTANQKRDDSPGRFGSSYIYDGTPIYYKVSKKGYYCVGTVPVTLIEYGNSDLPVHAAFDGTVHFHNTFNGNLPAADYPKIRFYWILTIVYLIVGGLWGYLCYKHREDIIPIQFYVSALVFLLVTEMLANWGYYRYLNAHGRGITAVAFLIVTAILDAGRNALSFFLLLVVALGWSVVREELPAMTRCKLLAIAHFVFGVMYAVAIVEVKLETISLTALFLLIMPLAFTLSTFLLWIMYGLQATIQELQVRKQTYKLGMFKRLYYILILAVIVIAGFFVATTLAFSSRYQEDFGSRSWPYRWWLMDGYLSILYLLVFSSIAFLWRPTGNNRR